MSVLATRPRFEGDDDLCVVPLRRDYALTDSGNAEAFAHDCGWRVSYDWARRAWFYFDGHRWVENLTAEVDRLALLTIRQRQQFATTISTDTGRRAAMKWALESENRARRENLLVCAAKIEGIADTGDRWDARPELLGVANGVLTPETGELRSGLPEDRITKVTPVPYDRHATCPRFDRFLTEIFEGEPDLPAYMQRVIGYTLTGYTVEQVFWILFGLGANGKSSLIETLFHSVFGGRDYAWAMPFPAAGWSTASSEYQKASLVGRRFVTANEVSRRGHLNEELIKSLTGDDTLNARHPYGRPFQFQPSAKFFLRVNEKPIIRDESHGMWRRVKLIEFRQRFPVDTTLSATLAGEAPGILAWAVRGCVDWRREGLREPACVRAATDEYRQESDPLAEFFDDRCLRETGSRVGGLELFAAYCAWCTDRQVKPEDRLSQKAFGLRIKALFPDVGNSRKTVYSGLGLRAESGLDLAPEDGR